MKKEISLWKSTLAVVIALSVIFFPIGLLSGLMKGSMPHDLVTLN